MEFNFWEMEDIETTQYEEVEVYFGSWKEADPDKW